MTPNAARSAKKHSRLCGGWVLEKGGGGWTAVVIASSPCASPRGVRFFANPSSGAQPKTTNLLSRAVT